jgi:hypothetical protein
VEIGMVLKEPGYSAYRSVVVCYVVIRAHNLVL